MVLQSENVCGKVNVKNGWIVCPHCRSNHRLLRIDSKTEAKNLPVFCRICRHEIILDIERGQSARRQSP